MHALYITIQISITMHVDVAITCTASLILQEDYVLVMYICRYSRNVVNIIYEYNKLTIYM